MADKILLGLDLRAAAVKVVEMKKTADGYIVTRWGMDEIPGRLVDKHPEKEVAQASVISKIISENHFKARSAALVIGGGDVVVKQFTLPKVSMAETKEAIRWKIRDEISYPVEEALIDFYPIESQGPNNNEIIYLVAAAPRSTIENGIEALRIAGLRTVAIIPVPIAVEQIFNPEIKSGAGISVIYMGKQTTNISFFKDGILQLSREIPVGGEDITKAMTSLLSQESGKNDLEYEQAEKIKREYGVFEEGTSPEELFNMPLSRFKAVIRPALEKVGNEILRTFEYYHGTGSETSIKRVIFTGGSAKTPHLIDFFKSDLGLPFEYIDPLSEISVTEDLAKKEDLFKYAPQFSAALGAVKANYEGKINLLPEALKDQVQAFKQQFIQPPQMYLLSLMVLGLVYLGLVWIAGRVQMQEDAVLSRLSLIRPRLIQLEAIEKSLQAAEGKKGTYQAISTSKIAIPEIMEEVSNNTPPSIMLNLLSFDGGEKQIKISGTAFLRADTPENIISKYMARLSKLKSFEKIQLVSAVKATNYILDAFTFEIMGVIRQK